MIERPRRAWFAGAVPQVLRLKEADAGGPKWVGPDTDLVMKAFPRSGNIFDYFSL